MTRAITNIISMILTICVVLQLTAVHSEDCDLYAVQCDPAKTDACEETGRFPDQTCVAKNCTHISPNYKGYCAEPEDISNAFAAIGEWFKDNFSEEREEKVRNDDDKAINCDGDDAVCEQEDDDAWCDTFTSGQGTEKSQCKIMVTHWKCLGENDKALLATGNVVALKDVAIGDYIFDGDLFSKVLTVEYGPQQRMLKLSVTNIENTTDETTVTMTGNHLLYDVNNELITAEKIDIGHVIFGKYVVTDITHVKEYSATPITFSGYLSVNGVKVSSYPGSPRFASLVHDYLHILRWLSDNVNEYASATIMDWLSAEYHFYYAMMPEEFWENSFNFHAFAPVVIAVIIGKRIFITSIIAIVGISALFAVVSKSKM